MQSRLLNYFLGVVEQRNISAAAATLNISQPALTRSIRQLEQMVGTTLFERLPTGVTLTRQGEILARRAKLMQLEYRHALAEIEALEKGLAGTLQIGAGPVWIASLLPSVVASFHTQFPTVKVRMTSGVIDTLVPALLAGDIDILCATLDFPSHPEIVKEPLLGMKHAVLARESHPLAGRGVATAQDLARHPWLVLTDDQVGTGRIGHYFAANNIEPPTIAVETTAMGMIKILKEGNFLAHFPERMLTDAEKFGIVDIPHEGAFWEADAGIAWRRADRPPRALESFKAIVRASLSS